LLAVSVNLAVLKIDFIDPSCSYRILSTCLENKLTIYSSPHSVVI